MNQFLFFGNYGIHTTNQHTRVLRVRIAVKFVYTYKEEIIRVCLRIYEPFPAAAAAAARA